MKASKEAREWKDNYNKAANERDNLKRYAAAEAVDHERHHEEVERLQEAFEKERAKRMSAETEIERLRRIDRAAAMVLRYAPMGHHLAATDEEWHEALRELGRVITVAPTETFAEKAVREGGEGWAGSFGPEPPEEEE